MINLAAIFNSNKVKSSLVTSKCNCVTHTDVDVTSSFFVSELDFDQFLADPKMLPYNFCKSPIADKDHGHILAVDLRIIKNDKLR